MTYYKYSMILLYDNIVFACISITIIINLFCKHIIILVSTYILWKYVDMEVILKMKKTQYNILIVHLILLPLLYGTI